MRELQYALRRLRGSPAFTIAATLTLAVAIGATASVFGVVDGVLLKPFPYREPERVLALWGTSPARHIVRQTMSPANFLDYRAQNTAFIPLAASRYTAYTVTGYQEPERINGLAVTPAYFPTLGLTPALGRFLAPDSGGPAEVVIGYGYWQRRFGGARSALGATLTLDGQPYTIVGVMPPELPDDTELWTRLSFVGDESTARSSVFLQVYGRLRPGVTAEQGQRELETIAARLAQAYPDANKDFSVGSAPLLETLLGPVRPALIMLLAAAACVLLIGAANLANLFLLRYVARERELAVRAALGASRSRLVRELVLEAMALGVAACALGVGLGAAGVRALRTLAPPSMPRLSQVGVDWRVIVFCTLAALAALLLFGVLPAWRASRGDVADVVKEGGRGTSPARHHRLQNALVVLQVAMALVLLTGAGLFTKSFEHFRRMDPGFRPDGVLTAQISPPTDTAKRDAFTTSMLERLAAVPGVRTASISSNLPSGPFVIGRGFLIVGDPPPDPTHVPSADFMCVSPDFFRTMGIPLRRGRSVLPTDYRHARQIVVVDELLARRYFPGRDPLGQRLVGLADTATIVGVVASVKQRGLVADDGPVLYAPFAQCASPFAFVEVRTASDPGALTASLRHAIFTVDQTVPVSDVETMSTRVAETVGTTRFCTFLASVFAAVALVLGAIGIYSVVAYLVAQRRRDIGVRIALGATHGHVIADVVRRAVALTGVGILLGSAAAWWATRALSSLFLGVSPHDPTAFVGAAFLFALVALVGASVPAFRSTRIDPVEALSST